MIILFTKRLFHWISIVIIATISVGFGRNPTYCVRNQLDIFIFVLLPKKLILVIRLNLIILQVTSDFEVMPYTRN